MSDPELMSLADVVQNPDRYHGRKVLAVGCGVMRFESKAVYASAADRENVRTKKAVWLDIPIDDAALRLNGRTILVEGEFTKEKKGHLGLFAGSLVDVTRLEEWSGDLNKEKINKEKSGR